jgi:hypothetical protein
MAILSWLTTCMPRRTMSTTKQQGNVEATPTVRQGQSKDSEPTTTKTLTSTSSKLQDELDSASVAAFANQREPRQGEDGTRK